jgi:antitoxin component of RelBE/YafQ-DinJ toxin-antitoxin module
MIRIRAMIESEKVDEATFILENLGISIEIAIGLFIRRIIKEGKVPFEIDLNELFEDEECGEKSYKQIDLANWDTEEMLETIWSAFLSFLEGYDAIEDFAEQISLKQKINKQVIINHMSFIENLINGIPSACMMKISNCEFYLKKIIDDLGNRATQKALMSIRLSIPFWRKKLPNVDELVQKVLKKTKL